MKHSPLTINLMLACYCSPDPESIIGTSTWRSAAGQDALRRLRESALIDAEYRATDRGTYWVRYICDVDVPASDWTEGRARTTSEDTYLGMHKQIADLKAALRPFATSHSNVMDEDLRGVIDGSIFIDGIDGREAANLLRAREILLGLVEPP